MKSRLSEIRRESGKKQEDVAHDLNVPIGTYRNWEQGITSLNDEKLTMLKDYFGLRDMGLFFEHGANASEEAMSRAIELIEDLSDSELDEVIGFVNFVMWKAEQASD